MSTPKKFLLGAGIALVVAGLATAIYTQSIVGHLVFDVGDGQAFVCEIKRSGDMGRCFPAEGEVK